MDGKEADNTRTIFTFQKGSDEKGGDKEEHLSTIQKNIENAAKKIKHQTNAQKEKEIIIIAETVSLSEIVNTTPQMTIFEVQKCAVNGYRKELTITTYSLTTSAQLD